MAVYTLTSASHTRHVGKNCDDSEAVRGFPEVKFEQDIGKWWESWGDGGVRVGFPKSKA